jgi:hypothetical protein
MLALEVTIDNPSPKHTHTQKSQCFFLLDLSHTKKLSQGLHNDHLFKTIQTHISINDFHK